MWVQSAIDVPIAEYSGGGESQSPQDQQNQSQETSSQDTSSSQESISQNQPEETSSQNSQGWQSGEYELEHNTQRIDLLRIYNYSILANRDNSGYISGGLKVIKEIQFLWVGDTIESSPHMDTQEVQVKSYLSFNIFEKMCEDVFSEYMDSDYYKVKVESASIYIPRDHYLGDVTEVAENLIIKQGRGVNFHWETLMILVVMLLQKFLQKS